MSKTSIMTLRVPVGVRRSLERLAAQLGYKPAHLGARLVEEGLRRRHFPQIELRDTAAGRVAYLKGTRLAVYWLVERVRKGGTAQKVARDFEISAGQINAVLAYAAAFPAEIELDLEEAQSNREWLELHENAWHGGNPNQRRPIRTKSAK
jgi:uncharacterized protein (DUF433 family)